MKDTRIATEGLPFILIGAAVTLISYLFIHAWLGTVALLFTLFTIYFFRNPKRVFPVDDSLVISPADGKVLKIQEVQESRFLNDRRIKISIFMSPLNVHVNRIPVKGRVSKVSYHPGKYLMAFNEKSSLANEHNAIVVESEKGFKVLFVQIAGFLARRIVCYLKEGDSVEKGRLFGLIRFGSRVDVYLPPSFELKISEGQHIKGGESVIARIR